MVPRLSPHGVDAHKQLSIPDGPDLQDHRILRPRGLLFGSARRRACCQDMQALALNAIGPNSEETSLPSALRTSTLP